jgi:hypothetical protein
MYHIYALVDPVTHLVRYVDETEQPPELRHRQHCKGRERAAGDWVEALAPLQPVLVVLETGKEARVVLRMKGVRRVREVSAWASRAVETKWIKRFRTAKQLDAWELC